MLSLDEALDWESALACRRIIRLLEVLVRLVWNVDGLEGASNSSGVDLLPEGRKQLKGMVRKWCGSD